MKSILSLAALAPLAFAVPVEKRQNIDTVVLQFALTLEHLENVFYKGALKNFSSDAFAAAGYGPNYYNSLKYIAADEQSHVEFLTTALTGAGQKPVQACTYKFPYTDVKSFITLSTLIEGVGTSAYLGAAPLITSKEYLTAAGSILVTEALHTSLQRSSIKAVPAANAYGTPLTPSPVYTLAAAFIVSCPAGNAALPFTAFPSLSVDNQGGYCEQPDCSPVKIAKREADAEANWSEWNNWQPASSTSAYYQSTTTTYYKPTTTTSSYVKPTTTSSYVKPTTTYSPYPQSSSMTTSKYYTPTSSSYSPPKPTTSAPAMNLASPPFAGMTASFTAANDIPAGSFLTFVSGLQITSIVGNISGKKISGTIPAGIEGQSYVLVTKSNITMTLTDDQILFGPAIFEVNPAPPMIDFNEA